MRQKVHFGKYLHSYTPCWVSFAAHLNSNSLKLWQSMHGMDDLLARCWRTGFSKMKFSVTISSTLQLHFMWRFSPESKFFIAICYVITVIRTTDQTGLEYTSIPRFESLVWNQPLWFSFAHAHPNKSPRGLNARLKLHKLRVVHLGVCHQLEPFEQLWIPYP